MLLAKTRNFTESKVWNSLSKKATGKIDVPKNQLKKCKLEVRRVFCNIQKNTTHSKLEKGALKIHLQMKHTNTTTPSKGNFASQDDDTRCRPRTLTSFCRPEALAWWLITCDQWKRQIPHCELAKCNHAAWVATRTPKYWKRSTKLHWKAVGMTYDKGRKPETVVSC